MVVEKLFGDVEEFSVVFDAVADSSNIPVLTILLKLSQKNPP